MVKSSLGRSDRQFMGEQVESLVEALDQQGKEIRKLRDEVKELRKKVDDDAE